MEKKNKVKFECEFCKRSFSYEKPFVNHSCEKKRRWFRKDEPISRIAFLAWNRFYELNRFGKKNEFRTNFHNFIDSQFYNSFIKFGQHIIDINAINPTKFIDYVLKNNIPINKWNHDIIYEHYINEFIKKESPEDALERNIRLMTEWGSENNEIWTNFFRKVNTNQAVLWVKTGKISPWVLYNVDSADDFFKRCTSEQISMISSYAPIGPWKLKFIKNTEACDFIKNTMKKNGI